MAFTQLPGASNPFALPDRDLFSFRCIWRTPTRPSAADIHVADVSGSQLFAWSDNVCPAYASRCCACCRRAGLVSPGTKSPARPNWLIRSYMFCTTMPLRYRLVAFVVALVATVANWNLNNGSAARFRSTAGCDRLREASQDQRKCLQFLQFRRIFDLFGHPDRDRWQGPTIRRRVHAPILQCD